MSEWKEIVVRAIAVKIASFCKCYKTYDQLNTLLRPPPGPWKGLLEVRGAVV